ncbi:hypothetical protein D3C72_1788860 [compost metagenome]
MAGPHTKGNPASRASWTVPRSLASTMRSPLSTSRLTSLSSDGAEISARVESTACLPELATWRARAIQSSPFSSRRLLHTVSPR